MSYLYNLVLTLCDFMATLDCATATCAHIDHALYIQLMMKKAAMLIAIIMIAKMQSPQCYQSRTSEYEYKKHVTLS